MSASQRKDRVDSRAAAGLVRGGPARLLRRDWRRALASAALGIGGLLVVESAASRGLDLHLEHPQKGESIEGRWRYQPLDGKASREIEIRETPGGFYELEGRRAGAKDPVLQLDRATDGARYRGQVSGGFDSCVPAGARVTIGSVTTRMEVEATYPVAAPYHALPSGPCRDAVHYYLVATGHGETVKLHAITDLGVVPAQTVQEPERAGGAHGSHEPPESMELGSTAATLAIGLPEAPDGAEVAILGTIEDARGRAWHRVRLAGARAETSDGENGRDGQPEEPAGARKGADTSVRTSGRKKSEPPSGYVAVQSVVARWMCVLEREGVGEERTPAAMENRP